MARSPKKQKASPQEQAQERRQSLLLDEEIAGNERRIKALARNKLGSKSLLSRAGMNKGGKSSIKSTYGTKAPTRATANPASRSLLANEMP